MDAELDLVTFVDDDGNEVTMEIIRDFFYEGEQYAILVEYKEMCDCEEDMCEHYEEDCDEQEEAYIMRVVPVGDDEEEFIPVEDEELFDRLIDFVQNELDADEDEEEYDEEYDDEYDEDDEDE